VAPLSAPDGRSSLPGSTALVAATVPTGSVSSDQLSLAVDERAALLMVAVALGTQFRTYTYGLPLTTTSTPAVSAPLSGRRPRVAAAGGGLFFLAFENTGAGASVSSCVTDGGAPDCPGFATVPGSGP